MGQANLGNAGHFYRKSYLNRHTFHGGGRYILKISWGNAKYGRYQEMHHQPQPAKSCLTNQTLPITFDVSHNLTNPIVSQIPRCQKSLDIPNPNSLNRPVQVLLSQPHETPLTH